MPLFMHTIPSDRFCPCYFTICGTLPHIPPQLACTWRFACNRCFCSIAFCCTGCAVVYKCYCRF
jgi:hypothetical protein